MDNISTSPALPQEQTISTKRKFKKFFHFFSSLFNGSSMRSADFMSTSSTPTRINSLKKNFKKNKFFYIPLVVMVLLIVLGYNLFSKGLSTGSGSASILGISGSKINIKPAKATQTLNKELQFPLKDASGKEVSKIRYIIESVETRDELIVKGKKAQAVEGRTFLVIKLKIINVYKQSIQVNARDYIRLTVGDGKDKFAADIHSDPVEIQPDSTKPSRLAFPINENDKNLSLLIGELNGTKETVKLNLQ